MFYKKLVGNYPFQNNAMTKQRRPMADCQTINKMAVPGKNKVGQCCVSCDAKKLLKRYYVAKNKAYLRRQDVWFGHSLTHVLMIEYTSL